MRILLVSDHYPPFIGGAHRQTQLLGSELKRRGHAVSVATVWHGGSLEPQDDAGVTVYPLKQLRTCLPWLVRDYRQRHSPPFPDPVTIAELARLIERLEPDLVHSYGWITFSCAAALFGKDTPLLASTRDYAYICANQTLLCNGRPCDGPSSIKCLRCSGKNYGMLKGWVAVGGVRLGRALMARREDGIHSISNYVQQVMERDFWNGRAPDTNTVIRSVIPSFREQDPVEPFSADPQVESYVKRLPKEPFILFVGALRVVKGLKQLVAAYERLVAPPPLVLIGTIEQDTPREMPPGILVLESFPHRAVMAAWEHALFGVLPSLWPEPLGSVVYEGMSRGKAVIGTAPGGHADMIRDGETGFLVPPGDVDALTHAMQILIDNPEMRERLGRAARERAKLFTADSAIPRFEQLYADVISKAGFRTRQSAAPVQY